jgi:hypothetical protein
MVSLNTIITLGGLGAAYLIFSRLGGGTGIGTAIGSQIGDFTGALGSGITQAVNRFGNLVETPEANLPEGYRLDPTETRDYNEYVNYQEQSTPQSKTSYGETGSGSPAFIFPDPAGTITPAPAITYGSPLPPFAGTLEYVVKTFEQTPIDQRFPNVRKATSQEKSFLQSYGIGL